MDIIFTGRHTEVLERFRQHATAKLAKVEKLDQRAIRVDVEVTEERNPRQSGRKERVELTVISPGPAIRAEAAAEDRFAALDMAMAKLENRMRRACDRRKGRHGAHAAIRLADLPEADLASDAELPAIRLGGGGGLLAGNGASAMAAMAAAADEADARELAQADDDSEDDSVVAVEMQGDGPLVVREKFHSAIPMTIDQALFEMELVGHDFFLFTDERSGLPSVVYRRRGYQYGVIRLMEDGSGAGQAAEDGVADVLAGTRTKARSGRAADAGGS
ncbi:MAG TPA: ribosome-associated translation inhibitor RaiA [Streptosporangiaceae bacterium]|nr:ribosome-associated translation inhibitor RaiA [Streptosporangiaceae bacterium]